MRTCETCIHDGIEKEGRREVHVCLNPRLDDPGMNDLMEFRPGTASGDCQTDGHYLCDGCSLMDPVVAYYRANGDWPPDGWNEETAP